MCRIAALEFLYSSAAKATSLIFLDFWIYVFGPSVN